MTESNDVESGQNFDIKSFLKGLTHRPGIYKMLNSQGDIIYIGKAKNLKNRVSSYFRTQSTSPKQLAMVSKV
ncbi:MAG TPA: excinuclease ABC subunit C, partial [Methylococcaceae bacterium]|nr:excinuclease ABC subunit C [Methylococcaceae bacterium]